MGTEVLLAQVQQDFSFRNKFIPLFSCGLLVDNNRYCVGTFDIRNLCLCVSSFFKESRRPPQCSPHDMIITVFTTPDDHHSVHPTRQPSQCSPHQTTITVFTTPDDHHSVHHTRRPSQCSPRQTIITVFTTPDDHHSVHHARRSSQCSPHQTIITVFTTSSYLILN